MAAAAPANNYSPGLEGVIAGITKICTVGKEGTGLSYRGFDVRDLAANCIFEEVAFLLIYGKLPNAKELVAYQQKLEGYRKLPQALCTGLEQVPRDAHPMDVLRTGCSLLGNFFPEDQQKNDVYAISDRLIASFGSILLYWYHFAWHNGRRVDTTGKPGDSVATHFVRVLQSNGVEPDAEIVRTIDASLILYAEHGFAASTFAVRVTTSTLSDTYSAVCAAIGTLRGPLHGGANEAAMELLERFADPEDAERQLLAMLARKEKIMGFGHRVYKICDPRNAIIKECSRVLSCSPKYGKPQLFAISERVEQVMMREKKLFPNLDFYAASAYHQCGLPTSFMTPVFVIARTAGWCAHVIEQRASNRLIRPKSIYEGPGPQPFLPMVSRL